MRLIDHIDKGLKRRPDAPAFIHHDSVMSFRQADDRARRIGHGLQQRLGTAGARVAVYSPNDPRAFCCVLGIVQAGAAWVPVNTRNPVHVNAAFLKLTQCELLFFHSSLALQVAEILAVTPSIRHCVCIDAKAGPGQIALGDLADNDGSLIGVPDDPDRVIMVFPTGGTTGLSKAALWTNRVLDSAISAFWTSCPLDTPPVHLVAAPMTHGAGAVAMMMIPRGTTNVILSKADPVAIMEAIERHGVTHMYLPPTLIYMILAHPDVRRYDYGSLRYLIIAAAPIAPAKLREALDVFGPCVCQSFAAPKSVAFWDELPRSPNNKVLKREIRQTFWPEGMRAVG